MEARGRYDGDTTAIRRTWEDTHLTHLLVHLLHTHLHVASKHLPCVAHSQSVHRNKAKKKNTKGGGGAGKQNRNSSKGGKRGGERGSKGGAKGGTKGGRRDRSGSSGGSWGEAENPLVAAVELTLTGRGEDGESLVPRSTGGGCTYVDACCDLPAVHEVLRNAGVAGGRATRSVQEMLLRGMIHSMIQAAAAAAAVAATAAAAVVATAAAGWATAATATAATRWAAAATATAAAC